MKQNSLITTGVYKTRSLKGVETRISWDRTQQFWGWQECLHLEHVVDLQDPTTVDPSEVMLHIRDKEVSLETYISDVVEHLLSVTAAMAVAETGFCKRTPSKELSNILLQMRKRVLQLSILRENKLLATYYKAWYKEGYSSLTKEYYSLCKKQHKEYVNSLLEELRVFSPMENVFYIYEK